MGQEDKARLIHKNFQGLSPSYLKECELGDLLSEVPREECSPVDKPKGPMKTVLCVKEELKSGRVIQVALELDAKDSGRRSELGWEGGLYYNQHY